MVIKEGTTTHLELFQLPNGGLLIDPPGMREFQLWNNSGSLESSFNDIEMLAQFNSVVLKIAKEKIGDGDCPKKPDWFN